MQQVLDSLRSAFWRRPDTFDFIVWAFCLGAFLLHCTSWPRAVYSALKWSFTIRVWMFIFCYGVSRWPKHGERIIFAPLAIYGLVLLVRIGVSTDWKSVAQMRPDWQGAGFVLAMGAAMLCFMGPLMWLLDHVFKPYAKRTGQRVFGAVGFIAVCGVWWSGLVFGLLALSNRGWW